MKRLLICLVIFSLLSGASTFVACSGDKEEKSAIEKMTEKAGKDMADKLTAPINKARSVKDQADQRGSEMEEQRPDD